MPTAPRVPRYDSPQLEQAGVPRVRYNTDAPVEAFGGGRPAEIISQTAIGLGEQGMKIALEEKKKADEVATQDAFARTRHMRQELIYNPETGAKNKRGKDVYGIVNEYGEQFDTGAQEIEDSLKNDEQKRIYRQIRAKEKMDFESDLNQHLFTESRKFDDEATASALAVSKNDAVLNYMNPDRLRENIKLQQSIVESKGRREGQSADWIAEKQLAVTSETHKDVVNRMLANNQDQLASKYYKQYADQMTEDDKTVLIKTLEEGSLRGQSQRITDKMMDKNLTSQQAYDEIRKIQDPKLRDAVSDRYKSELSTQKAIADAEQNALFNSASQVVETTQSRDSIPPNVWLALDNNQREAIDRRIKNLREGVDATDPKRYYELTQIIANDRQAFMSRNLLLDKPFLSMTDFKKFSDMQAEAKNGNSGKIDGFMSDRQVVDGVLTQNGFDIKTKSKNKRVEMEKFYEKVDTLALQQEQRTGKKATNDDLRAIANKQMVEFVTQKGFLGTNLFQQKKRAFELEQGEAVLDIVVPEKEFNSIVRELEKRGLPWTKDDINEIYVESLNRGR